MGRPSKREVSDAEDLERAFELLQAIIEAHHDFKDDYVDWAIEAVERIREHYGQ